MEFPPAPGRPFNLRVDPVPEEIFQRGSTNSSTPLEFPNPIPVVRMSTERRASLRMKFETELQRLRNAENGHIAETALPLPEGWSETNAPMPGFTLHADF